MICQSATVPEVPISASRLRKAADHARMKLENLRSRTVGLMEVLYSVQSLHSLLSASRQSMDQELFQRFVKQPMDRHSELQALAWSPVVPHENRASFEKKIGKQVHDPAFFIKDFNTGGLLGKATERASYIPLTYLAPVVANTVAQGFDLASEPRRQTALLRARDTGEPFTTSPLRLVQETGNQLGCLIVLPVYSTTAATEEERRTHLIGFVSAAFRISDMVDAFLNQEMDPTWLVEVTVYEKSESAQIICSRGDELPTDREEVAVEWLEFSGARWRVRVMQSNTGLAENYDIHPGLEYRSLFDDAVVGMFRTTAEGSYLAANPAMAHLYGYSSPEMLMSALSDIGSQLYVDPARRTEFVHVLQHHDTISGFESQIRKRDGSLIWITEKARGIRDADGRLLYYEGTVEDITEQRLSREALARANEELQQRLEEHSTQLVRTNAALSVEIEERKRAEKAAAAANEAKSVFLSHMSHEIRTPLNAVIGYTQILQRDDSLNNEQQQAVQSLANGSSHLLSLVDNLLDLAKIEAGRMESRPAPFNIQSMVQLLQGMFRHHCQQKKLTLQVEHPDSSVTVVGDEGMLRQVLINLLSNAVKFTDAGSIRLTVVQQNDSDWRFDVADTGMGIEPELQAAIFEPYQQSSSGLGRGGTGLGLAIIKRQIEIMGGVLTLDSTPGLGSCFSFVLPMAAGTPLPSPFETTQLRPKPGMQVRALVVDDIEENRELLARMLRMTGCEVEAVADGPSAIEAALKIKPDIVFMDIWMPGMNGIESAQKLLQEFRKKPVKIIAHSATAFAHEAEKFLETGFEDFMPKPFRFERLCTCLNTHLPDYFITEEPADQLQSNSHPLPILPTSSARRLLETAENYNITGLKECVEELKAPDSKHSETARRLGQMLAAYDMAAVIKFAEEQLRLASDS